MIDAGVRREFTDLLEFGISYWVGNKRNKEGTRYSKGRFGIDFRLQENFSSRESLIFQGEFITNIGDTAKVDDAGRFLPDEIGEAKASGYFFELGYRFMVKNRNPETKSPAHFLTPMIKYDFIDCDSPYLNVDDTTKILPWGASTIVALGFNYEISGSAYFQIFYEMRMERKDKSDAREIYGDDSRAGKKASPFHNDQLIVQFGFKF